MVNMKGWQLFCEDGIYSLYYLCVQLNLFEIVLGCLHSSLLMTMYSVVEVKSVISETDLYMNFKVFTSHTFLPAYCIASKHTVNYKCRNFVKLFSDVLCVSGTLN